MDTSVRNTRPLTPVIIIHEHWTEIEKDPVNTRLDKGIKRNRDQVSVDLPFHLEGSPDSDQTNFSRFSDYISSACTGRVWKKHRIILCLTFVVTFFGGMSITLTVTNTLDQSPPCDQLTPRGTHDVEAVTRNILRYINVSRNPCDSMEAFACGGFDEQNPLLPGWDVVTVFNKMEQEAKLINKCVLEKVDTSSPNPRDAYVKARWYYESCSDTDSIENIGAEPLLDLIKRLGGWHIIPGSSGLRYDWNLQRFLQEVQLEYHLAGLFSWQVTENDYDSSKYVIEIDQVKLTLPNRSDYINKTGQEWLFKKYVERMTNICVQLGASTSVALAEMYRVIDMETDLAEITTSPEEMIDRDELYNTYTLSDWQKEVPFLNWTSFFNNAFKLVNHTISEDEKINVITPTFFKKLNILIKRYSGTIQGQRTIKSSVMMRIIYFASKHLSKSFRDVTQLTWTPQVGIRDTPMSWGHCVTETVRTMELAVGAMFVKEAFHDETKTANIRNMVRIIRNSLKQILESSDLLDAETKKAVEEKADAIKVFVGYPDFILNKTELNEYYKELVVKPGRYFENNLAFDRFNLKNNLKLLGKPTKTTRLVFSPTRVVAYYKPTMSIVVLMAALLQSPVYCSGCPMSFNFGGLGSVTGHELTHPFDDQGRKYDKFGNLHPSWTDVSITKFEKRAKYMVHQYSAFTIDGQHLNGKYNLGENIADNAGLKAAYYGYLEYRKHATTSQTLPGVPYNDIQLFFIAYAQLWCSHSTKKHTKLIINTDIHSVAKYRIDGPLMNMKEFSEAFKCPVGSKMNPIDKSGVW